jgi:radical SAM protein with 4Fe4S-binding SPASM domain
MNSETIVNDARTVRLAPGIRLRPEYFGGLVYDRHKGYTLEVDKTAFRFLYFLQDGPQRIADVLTHLNRTSAGHDWLASFDDVLRQLQDMKIIDLVDDGLLSPTAVTAQRRPSPFSFPWLSAPETVHWAATYRCEAHCPDCYVERLSHARKELDTSETLCLIDKLADWKVFQLVIGGGEPFVRNDLPQLVRHAAQQDLVVHLTTGRLNTPQDVLDKTLPSVRNLQIGIWNEALLNTRPGLYKEQLVAFFLKTQQYQTSLGANVVLNKTAMENLVPLVAMLSDIGFERIIFLRYKPSQSIKHWKAEIPETYQLKKFHTILQRLLADNAHLSIRVDCALSFVQRHLSLTVSAECGLKGCVAADRIMAIAADGSIYPCSQLVHDQSCGGNILEADPGILWNESKALRKYRFFQAQKTFKNSWCGQCLARQSCGGCRIFARDGMGGDPGCPEPVLSARDLPGKEGRRLDSIGHTSGRVFSYHDLAQSINDPGYTQDYPEWMINDRGECDHEDTQCA